jgi:putative hemolysin
MASHAVCCCQVTSRVVLTLMGVNDSNEENVSEEELRMIIMGAKVSGQIRTEEQDMIESVLDLQDTLVTAIMKPRVEIVAVEASTDIRTFVRAVSESGYSRIPVYDDNIDNIIGMVLAKSLIDYLDKPDWIQGIEKNSVADIMDPAYYVPESMNVWNALEEMRLRRIHMAIVVDEYGGTAGLITLEDILEEVIGEIYDEDDIEEVLTFLALLVQKYKY